MLFRSRGKSDAAVKSKKRAGKLKRLIIEGNKISKGTSVKGRYEADVAEVLLKIQTEHSVRLSQSIAQNVIDELARTIVVHNNKTKSAGFIVLKNPAIPSILVETGFISNREDEKNLRSKKYQQKVANSIVRGVHDYFRANTPMGVRMANIDLVNSGPMTHRVSRGDTLSGIAHKYGVSMKQLRRTNNLKGDKLLVGKNLIIPI